MRRVAGWAGGLALLLCATYFLSPGVEAPVYEVVDLETLGGAISSGSNINDRGQVCGSARTASGDLHAFVWQRGRMTDLGTLGGTLSMGLGMNPAGQVVGRAETTEGRMHAFVWRGAR